ncbi:MAG: hypothetical protein HZA93_24015 [Verrucomicrobia bacterium]|nr:hypothetical protein [Verrucomicrobiota bacterium]
MQSKSGAINPTTGSAAQPSLLLPSAEFEDAITVAGAMLELLSAYLVEVDREGEQTYAEPPHLSAIRIAAATARRELDRQLDAHCAEVRRLRHLAPLPFNPSQS